MRSSDVNNFHYIMQTSVVKIIVNYYIRAVLTKYIYFASELILNCLVSVVSRILRGISFVLVTMT